MNRLRKIFLSFLTASLLILSACGKEALYQDLTELEANEILVALYKSGIEASKEKVQSAQEVSYTVTVSKDELQKARQILVDNKLPRKRSMGFSEICKETSIIPTPEQEKCRKLLALKGEIVNSLERIPGVVEADVVLNIPEVSEFSVETQTGKKPTASAVLMVKKDSAGYEITESRIQRFISNGVENLDPRDVAVIINFLETPEEAVAKGKTQPGATPAQPGQPTAALATVMGLNLDLGSVKKFKIYAAVMLVLLMGVSAALIMSVIKLTRMRQELKVSKAQSGLSEAQAGAAPMLEGGTAPPEAQLGPGDKKMTQV